jgi:hypothetical protein
MNTKIATTFGLALMLALGIFGAMLALGTFKTSPATVHASSISEPRFTTISPTTARETAQYTVAVTATTALSVGQRIFVKFPSGTTVPSSIATSGINLKASALSAGAADQLQNPSAVTVSGREVQITVPDMDQPTTSNGQNGIAAGADVTINFLQAAGIVNPNLAKATYTFTAWTDADTTAVTSAAYTINSDITISSTSKPRGDVITVTGVGLAATCTTCNIRFKGDSTIHGSGSIDANGVFSGTFNVDSGTGSDTAAAALAVEVTDINGATYTSDTTCGTCSASKVAQTFQNKAGATPTVTSAIPGATVSVDLTDYSTSGTITSGTTTVGLTAAINYGSTTFDIDATSADTGTSLSTAPYKFVVPAATVLATHKVTVTDGTKSATFNLDVVTNQKTLTVTPTTAAIGQSITVSGTGFTKNGTIAASAVTGSGGGILNAAAITIDSAGNWSLSTRVDTIEASASRVSDAYTITATDGATIPIVGKSTAAGFSRTPRALTVSPTTASPGDTVTISGTGMTVDTNEVTTTAEVTISSNKVTLTGTLAFPVGADGTFSGTIKIPTTEVAGTVTLTATDNAAALNSDATVNRTATAKVTVPSGTVTVSPASGTTGEVVTVTGSGFPPSRTASVLTIDGADAIPVTGVTTDGSGDFTASVEVPAQTTGGSLLPGAKIVVVTIGEINGTTTGFTVPNPTISLDHSTASVEDTIVITGTGYDALTSVTTLTIGTADVNPSPAPRATATGDITANVLIPALNIGTYTVVMQTGTSFSGSATFTAVTAPATPTVTAVDAATGSIDGGTAVTITGTDFADGATVTVGGTAATSVAFVSSTSLTATTPAGDSGAADVVVTNPLTTGPLAKSGTLSGGFTYETAAEAAVSAGTEGAPESVFSETVTSDAGLQVWSYAGQAWSFYDASLAADHPANDLSSVQAGDGVWIFNSTDADITSTILGRSITIVPGWNLKGL